MIKYPKTPRYDGSKIDVKPSTKVIVQEKLDGANVGISFEYDKLVLQSRSRILDNSEKEVHFKFFKRWAKDNKGILWSKLGNRYLIFAEYLYIKHRIYYENLPSYFCALDIYDKDLKCFVNDKQFDFLVPDDIFFKPAVLYEGTYRKLGDVNRFIKDSMEGVYLRFEDGTRMKYPRPEFQKIKLDDDFCTDTINKIVEL